MSQEGLIDIIAAHPEIPIEFIANVGTASPIANTLELLGSVVAAGINPFQSIASGNTVDYQIQLGQSFASSVATRAGIVSFDSSDFNVDANGFVTFISAGENWFVITASQTLAINTGYICASPGGALSLPLPATSSIGDIIEITLDGATSFSVTQGAGQSIKIGNTATTSGVGGSLTSTQQGDSIRMVCSVTNLRWNVISSMGNPTII